MIQKANRQGVKMKMASLRDGDYAACVCDLIKNDMVWSMNDYMQHVGISCLEHSFDVSYISYSICKRLGLDFTSASRGGLLHDFFLYDWHDRTLSNFHLIKHPRIALENANKYFELNDLEKEIIRKHMWPITLAMPIHKETFVVMLVDKYCTCKEVFQFTKKMLKAKR